VWVSLPSNRCWGRWGSRGCARELSVPQNRVWGTCLPHALTPTEFHPLKLFLRVLCTFLGSLKASLPFPVALMGKRKTAPSEAWSGKLLWGSLSGPAVCHFCCLCSIWEVTA
jgi:hypothetical protein